MLAASASQLEIVKILLANGADKSMRTAAGLTALDFAKRIKNPELIQLLADAAAPTLPLTSKPSSAPKGGSKDY
jgi:ankyrin repeat protein